MRVRGRVVALIAGAALLVTAGLVLAPNSQAAVTVSCSAPAWAEGTSYRVGDQVTYGGRLYQALQANTPPVGAGWTPPAVPALWKDLGACTGTPPTTPPPTTPAPPTTPPPTTAPPTTAPPTS